MEVQVGGRAALTWFCLCASATLRGERARPRVAVGENNGPGSDRNMWPGERSALCVCSVGLVSGRIRRQGVGVCSSFRPVRPVSSLSGAVMCQPAHVALKFDTGLIFFVL